MPELINWTRSPIVVTGDNGKRVTILPGQSAQVEGDFSSHPWVKKGHLEVADECADGVGEAVDDSDELEILRLQYQNIFGKPPHKNAGAASIRKKIDEWRNQTE